MNCKEGTKNIAQQITNLLTQLDPMTYAKPLPVFNGSSIGQHFRHIIDFYDCLLSGCLQGKVDYASRKRQTEIESNPEIALDAFNRILTKVEQLDETESIDVKADFSADDQFTRPIVRSSIGRELMFASDHAIHHLALIKIGLQTAFPGLNIDRNLGVAPSTIKFQTGKNIG